MAANWSICTSSDAYFASDALNIKWSDSITGETDQPVVSFVGATPVTATINGTVRNDVYMVGSEGTAGSIVLKGFAKELFNALPAGFYASRWNNAKLDELKDRVKHTGFEMDK